MGGVKLYTFLVALMLASLCLALATDATGWWVSTVCLLVVCVGVALGQGLEDAGQTEGANDGS